MYMIKSIAHSVSNVEFFTQSLVLLCWWKATSCQATQWRWVWLPCVWAWTKKAHQAPTHPSFLTDQTKPSDSAFSQVQERRNNCPPRNRGGWAVPYSDALHSTRMLSGAPRHYKIQPKLRTLLATDCQSLSFFHFFCLLTASYAKRTSFSLCPQIPVSKAFPRNNPILFPM